MHPHYVAHYAESHVEDADLYSLDRLQFHQSQQLKIVGKGGFGSILLAHLPKRIDVRIKPHHLVSTRKLQEAMLHDLTYRKENALGTPDADVIDPRKVDSETLILVAVKKMSDYDPQQLEDLIREASRLRNLWGSRNVVKVYGIVQNLELGCPCIVMDVVRGPSLNAFLRSYATSSEKFVKAGGSEIDRHNRLVWTLDQTLWWKKKLEIFRELIFALMLCHKKQIFHGDLKGENVLLDEFLIPKLVDFGLSFITRKDLSYFKTCGGSLFFVCPEIYEANEPPEEVRINPYPSDVYSLGMILVEMFVEGQIPSEVGDSFLMDKLQGGSPIPLRMPPSSHTSKSFFETEILGRINDLVEGCCSADREDRFSLQQCLAAVEDLYSLICSGYRSDPDNTPDIPSDIEDLSFVRSGGFCETLARFRVRFPAVPECVVLQPSKNMIVDSEGHRLIHYFCRLDYAQGVKYILEKARWGLEPSRDALEMAYICVEEGSLSVLKFMCETWKGIISEEINLVHVACDYDNPAILRFLIFDLNMDFDSYYESVVLKPIHNLAYYGRIGMIEILLEKAVNRSDYVNTVCFWGGRQWNSRTPLHHAVLGDQAQTVEFLLKRGGTVHRSSNLATLACSCGSIQVVKKLLELGDNFDEGTIGRHNPLLEICWNGHEKLLDLVKVHIKNKKHIDAYPNSIHHYPPLHYLCKNGRTNMAKILILEMGADVRFVNREGNTFLHEVSNKGNKEIAELLLSHGVERNLENNTGLTALDIAVKMGHEELQDLLLQMGCTRGKGPKLRDDEQKTSEKRKSEGCNLTELIEDGKLEEVKQALAKENFRSNYNSEAQLNLVKICCEKGYLDILKILHEHGVDLHGKVNPQGWKSPLHWAAKYGYVDIIKYLLEKGVQVNVAIGSKVSSISPMAKLNYTEALHFAADKQKLEAMEVLLQAGADANAIDYHNTTAMDRAIGLTNKRMIKLLIEYGFDTARRDRDDQTYMSLIADIF